MSLNERLEYIKMKARHEKKLRPWYKKWWGVLVIVFLTIIFLSLILLTVYTFDEIKKIRSGETGLSPEKTYQEYVKLVNGPGGYAIGASNPKITVIEFTDFACPFCKQSAPEIRKLVEEYKDNVRLIIRDYPIHDTSINLALAARCAGEQNKYWEAYDSLFVNQDNLINLETIESDLLSWAEFVGLDIERFKNCFSNRRYVDAIKRDYDDANSLEIKGTPTWFVNNYPLTGYYTESSFRELFDGLLMQLK